MSTAVQYTLLTDIQTAIQGRGLTMIDGEALSKGQVILQAVASNLESELPADPYPCIVIAPLLPEDLPPDGGTNIRDDVTYKIVVAILASKKDDFTPPDMIPTALNTYLFWRESLRHLLHNRRFPSSGSTAGQDSWRAMVTPLPVVDRGAWFQRGLFASAMLVNCISREVRG